MQNVGKIVGVNLLVMVAYFAISFAAGEEAFFFLMFLIGIHVTGNFIAGIVMLARRHPSGGAVLLSSAVCLLVGFSGCFAMLSGILE